jgi:hypothetical protein
MEPAEQLRAGGGGFQFLLLAWGHLLLGVREVGAGGGEGGAGVAL